MSQIPLKRNYALRSTLQEDLKKIINNDDKTSSISKSKRNTKSKKHQESKSQSKNSNKEMEANKKS